MEYYRKYKKYLSVYLCSIAIFASALLMNYMFLKRSGELLNEKQIYELQNLPNQDLVLYGSGIFNSSDNMRLYAYEMKKPKIIALGSSRVLEFKQLFFSQPFYNLGTTVNNVQEAVETTSQLLALHKPEIIIFGIDFWWFHNQEVRFAPLVARVNNVIDPAHLLKPFVWIKEKKLTLAEYFKIQFNLGPSHLGVKGKISNSGIGPDGSYYRTDIATGINKDAIEVDFSVTKDMIRNGTNRFLHGSIASDACFRKFKSLVEDLKSKGIQVILFFPPLPKAVTDLMGEYEYSYIEDLKQKFVTANIQVHDYIKSSEVLSTSDCEFLDGYHGGDILYAKILKDLATKNNGLSTYLHIEFINDVSYKYAGLVMIPNTQLSTKAEIDFLCLGCSKQPI